MPSAIVKIKNRSKKVFGGNTMIEIIGYDHTNTRGFKKRIFLETQDGNETKVYGQLQAVANGSWVKISMDDSKWGNITAINPCDEPEGGEPESSGGSGGKPAAAGSPAPAAPAGKKRTEYRTVAMLNRDIALGYAVNALTAGGKTIGKASVGGLETLTKRFYLFLTTGEFEKAPEPEPKAEDQNQPEQSADAAGTDSGEDDDIPF